MRCPTAFRAIDKDGSGSLDYSEFMQAMRRLGLGLKDDQTMELARAMDADGDGTIDIEEFCAALERAESLARREKPWVWSPPGVGGFGNALPFAEWLVGAWSVTNEGEGPRPYEAEAFGALERATARLAAEAAASSVSEAPDSARWVEATRLQLRAHWMLADMIAGIDCYDAAAALVLSLTTAPLGEPHASLCREFPDVKFVAAALAMRRAELLLEALPSPPAAQRSSVSLAKLFKGAGYAAALVGRVGSSEGGTREEGQDAGVQGGEGETEALQALEAVTKLLGDRAAMMALELLIDAR